MSLLVAVLVGVGFLGAALTALPAIIVEVVGRTGPDVVFQVGTSEQVVALSIDDGPSEATQEILDVLAEHGASATFFVIGAHVREHPELARRLLEEGHELGHHMMEDVPSIRLPPDTFTARFEEMDALLDGFGGSSLFRPGSGWYDARMVEEVERLGYRTILGSVYPFDAHLPFPGFGAWWVFQHLAPGAILVLHDGPERGLRTAEVLRRVLPELRRRGYRVVTVSALLAEADSEVGRRDDTPAG